ILEFMPRAESVSWAESVLQANPDKQVIVVTHSFTNVDGTRVDLCDTDDMPPGNATGDDLWQVLRKYPNVMMVLSGHLTNGHAAHRTDIADNGNLVNEIFANYQTFPHGGDGWLRILTFHPTDNSISVQTYSPSLNKFKTDAGDQFKVPYRNPHLHTGQGKLSGMVRTASDCSPLAGVTVSTNEHSTVTDEDGRYSFDLPPGCYHKLAYQHCSCRHGSESRTNTQGGTGWQGCVVSQGWNSECQHPGGERETSSHRAGAGQRRPGVRKVVGFHGRSPTPATFSPRQIEPPSLSRRGDDTAGEFSEISAQHRERWFAHRHRYFLLQWTPCRGELRVQPCQGE